MEQFEINDRIIQYVAGIFEANSLEEAQELAKQAFADGECMMGDCDIEIEEG